MSHPMQSSADALMRLLEESAKYHDAMDQAAEMLSAALIAGNKMLVCGNGGSACDGAHLAGEFVGRFLGERRPYPAICLAAEGGILTCIGNDYEFGEIFARQVRAYGKTDDVLIIFTSSGNSQNLVEALKEADILGMKSIAFLGRDGGRCAGLANVEFIVPGKLTARIQEMHKFLLHVLCEMVEREIPVD